MKPTDFHDIDDQHVVYVREVKPDDLPPGVAAPQGGHKFYAIHDSSGARLGLTDDRRMAFVIARQHDKTPVSVH